MASRRIPLISACGRCRGDQQCRGADDVDGVDHASAAEFRRIIRHAGGDFPRHLPAARNHQPRKKPNEGEAMSHRLTGRSVLMGITIIAGALAPGTAGAAPAVPGPTNLTLTVHQGADTRTAVLHCDPAGGDHPRATAACRELASIGGRLQELSSRRPERLCTMDYRP